jgi:hypothetical protein
LARKSSYGYKKASEASEEWSDLVVKREGSRDQAAIIEQIYAEYERSSDNVLLEQLPEDNNSNGDAAYVKTLNYMPSSSKDAVALHYSGNDLRSVASRLTCFMHTGYPIPYSILRDKIERSKVSDQTIVTALSVCAVMIRGNYCLNSKFLPTLPDKMKRARTFFLLLLQKRGALERTRLMQVYNTADSVSSESLLVLLRTLSKFTDQGWVLKIEDDLGHIMRFPDSHRLHEEYWESQAERYKDEISRYDA